MGASNVIAAYTATVESLQARLSLLDQWMVSHG